MARCVGGRQGDQGLDAQGPAYASLGEEGQALHRLGHRPEDVEGSLAAVPGVGAGGQDPGRARHHLRAEDDGQAGRGDRHRHRLRPRRRAHRQRCAFDRAAGEQDCAGLPRAVLGDHERGDRARLRRVVARRRLPRAGGGVAPGHRPGVGRRAHPVPDDGQVRRLRQRPLGWPRPDSDAVAHRRARA